MPATFPIKHGVLQGDFNANGYTIFNLDLTGLGLTKSSVGLDQVNNTSDLNKPISNATAAALALKENFITAGTTAQVWRGDKTWMTYGALALQNGNTTLSELSSIGGSASAVSLVYARRNDWSSSFAGAGIKYYGASAVGDILTGVPAANAGVFEFINAANGVIFTNGSTPLIFGTNSLERMRLLLGLNVGGTTDPGFGFVQAVQFVGGGAGITGLTAGQIPSTLNATTFPNLTINGEDGLGYIRLGAQISAPAVAAAHIYATSSGRVAFGSSGGGLFAMSFDNTALTADCIYVMPNWTAGTLESRVAVPASAAAAGVAGQKAYDASFEYRCIASGNWVRSAHATW